MVKILVCGTKDVGSSPAAHRLISIFFMRTFVNFSSNVSSLQTARVIPNSVVSLRPVNLFGHPRLDQMQDLTAFYVPTNFAAPQLHSAFSYKYFLAKWSRYEYKKNYNKYFKSPGVFPLQTVPNFFFEKFVPAYKKSKFFNKTTNVSLYFKNQPITGTKSFIRYKVPTENFFSYFDAENPDVYTSLSVSKKIRFALPRYNKFTRFRYRRYHYPAKKKFFAASHRFYVLNFLRGVTRKKRRINQKKFRRFFRFSRRIRRIYRKRRQWIAGNVFENFLYSNLQKLRCNKLKKFKRTRAVRLPKYLYRKRRFHRFRKYIKKIRLSFLLRRKIFRSMFKNSRKRAAKFLLQRFSVSKVSRTKLNKLKKRSSLNFKFVRFSKFFKIFSFFFFFSKLGGSARFFTSVRRNFVIKFFKIFKKFNYLSRFLTSKKLVLARLFRQFSLFRLFFTTNFVRPLNFSFLTKAVKPAVSRLRKFQRREFVRLYRFITYFNLSYKIITFPRDEFQHIQLRINFFHFLYEMTSLGQHFYALPLIFNKNFYFGTSSFINPDLYSRSVDSYSGTTVKAYRPRVFRISTTF